MGAVSCAVWRAASMDDALMLPASWARVDDGVAPVAAHPLFAAAMPQHWLA